jgi:hypothetical protein
MPVKKTFGKARNRLSGGLEKLSALKKSDRFLGDT